MRRLRRLNTTTTIELTPMIDVVFLLLTFFIFSIALMVRADVLGVSLPDLTSGVEAERVEPITVTLRADGSVSLMGEAVAREGLVEAIRTLRQTRPDAPVLLAADVEAGAGQLIELADALVGAGITRFSVVGRRAPADSGGGDGGAEGGAP
jgi:biopolymer transport protein ExbD